nr:tape measure protein [Cytobacillus horneckiae]
MLRNGVNNAFKRIDTMEQFERTMTTMLGSTEAANKALEDTTAIVTGTGYGLDTAAGAVQRFVTSSVDVNDATRYVEAFGDAVAFYGDGTDEQFSRVSRAMAQMATSGKTNIGDINSLLDAGIPVFEIYGDAMGMTAAEARKALEGGGTDAAQFIDVLTKAFNEGTDRFASIEGAAKNAGASWTGTFDNMRAAVTRGVQAIIMETDRLLTENGLPDMRTMIAQFGKAFENTLKKIAEAIPKVINKIKEIYETIKPWLPLLSAVAIGVGSVITGIMAFRTVKGYITAIKLAFLALNGTIWANPITWLVAAVIAAAVLIYYYWEPISKFFKKLWDEIKEWGSKLWEDLKLIWVQTVEWFVSVWGSLKSFFSNLWAIIKDFAVSIWESVIAKWNEVITTVKTLFAPLIEFFMSMWETVKTNALEYWNNITEMFSVIWDNIQSVAAAAWEIIKNVILGPILLLIDLVKGDMESFKSHLAAIWENIKQAGKTIWDSLKTIITTIISTAIKNIKLAWDTFKTYISGLWAAVWGVAKNIFEKIKTSVSEKTTQAKTLISNIWENTKTAVETKIRNMWQAIKGKFEDIKTSTREKTKEAKERVQKIWNDAVKFFEEIDLYEIGKNIIQGLIKGIGSMAEAVWSKARSIAGGIGDAIMKRLDIHSPSRVAIELMRYFGDGMVIGLDKSIRSVTNMAKNIATAVIPDIPKNAVSDQINKVKNLALNSMSSLGEVLNRSIPTLDIAGQINGINNMSQARMQNHVFSEMHVNKQPANINVRIGQSEFNAFIDDISQGLDRKAFRKGKRPGRA